MKPLVKQLEQEERRNGGRQKCIPVILLTPFLRSSCSVMFSVFEVMTVSTYNLGVNKANASAEVFEVSSPSVELNTATGQRRT